MKFSLVILMSFLFIGSSFAEIAQHDETTLESDLGFRWEDGSEDANDRDVASEEEEYQEEDSERDVASEAQGESIQFWKYEGEK
ncbi:MAG: hypothetical protein CME65_02130 [Halobacteriovoraceae bacterium]|nr:hypothetical protein [Halobacteriovoraceae bacterium]|tara:strand:+ start:14991 stop:15242 length:252 start_codon:yes stop_codon:yes gene_type:complete